MKNASFMCIRKSLRYVLEDCDSRSNRDRTTSQNSVFKANALEVFHHHIWCTTFSTAEVQYLYYRWMIELAGCLCFILKTHQLFRCDRTQTFDRYLLTEEAIASQIN